MTKLRWSCLHGETSRPCLEIKETNENQTKPNQTMQNLKKTNLTKPNNVTMSTASKLEVDLWGGVFYKERYIERQVSPSRMHAHES